MALPHEPQHATEELLQDSADRTYYDSLGHWLQCECACPAHLSEPQRGNMLRIAVSIRNHLSYPKCYGRNRHQPPHVGEAPPTRFHWPSTTMRERCTENWHHFGAGRPCQHLHIGVRHTTAETLASFKGAMECQCTSSCVWEQGRHSDCRIHISLALPFAALQISC